MGAAGGALRAVGSLGRGKDEAHRTRIMSARPVPDSEARDFLREDGLGSEVALTYHTLTDSLLGGND